jgi:hypothetical protein
MVAAGRNANREAEINERNKEIESMATEKMISNVMKRGNSTAAVRPCRIGQACASYVEKKRPKIGKKTNCGLTNVKKMNEWCYSRTKLVYHD